jgi:DNA-binding winged helix-turn-helix (wHTH) protein
MGDTGTAPAAAALPGDILRFDSFTLDSRTGTLLADARSVVLRPKTAAVLRFLLDHAGEMVARDTILEAVWPDVSVTDDSLTQCVSEIRRALGAAGPAMLRTLPRRGYMLATTVERQARLSDVPAPLPAQTPIGSRPAARPYRAVGWGVVVGAALLLAGLWLLRPWQAPPGNDARRAEAAALADAGTQVMYGAGDFADRMRRSVALFDRAVALDPNQVIAAARASFAHANLLITDNSQDRAWDLAEAARYAALAEAAAPGHPIATQARAGVLRQQGRLAEALVLFERVAEEPGETSARAVAAHLRVLLGRPAQAIPLLQALLAQAPGHPWFGTWQLHLAQAQLYAGDSDFGAAAFDVSPSRPGYMRAEERLCHRAAALWLGGQRDQARMILADLMARRPEVSLAWLRARRSSSEPAFVALFEARLMAPLLEAGLRP